MESANNTIQLRIPNFTTFSPVTTPRNNLPERSRNEKVYNSYNFIAKTLGSTSKTPEVGNDFPNTERLLDSQKYYNSARVGNFIGEMNRAQSNILIEEQGVYSNLPDINQNHVFKYKNRINRDLSPLKVSRNNDLKTDIKLKRPNNIITDMQSKAIRVSPQNLKYSPKDNQSSLLSLKIKNEEL